MKFRLPYLGQVTIGKDNESETSPVIQTAKDYGGSFLDYWRAPLSNEKEISSKLIKANEEWVFINVSTLAEAVAVLEFELFQFKMIDGQIELEPIEEHELLDLLDGFNEVTTKADAIYNTEAHMDLTGDAFWYLEGGIGKKKPKKIYLMQPDAMTLKLGDFTKAGSVLVEQYVYKVTVNEKTIEEKYHPEEIIHIKVPNPANPYRGKSVPEAIATTIDTDNYAQEALKNLFKNGMVADFFLSTEKRLNPDQIKNLSSQFRAAYQGVRNFWKIPILFGGVEPKPLAQSGRETQLRELEEWFRNKIMSAFKNTRASLGLDDEVNRATAEASLAHWKRTVIAPKMGRIVNSLNEYLVPRYGENLVLGFKDPVPEDRASEISEAKDLFGAKIITRNEARQILDYEEVEGGDEFEQPQQFNPLEQDFGKKLKKSIPALKYVNYKKVFRKANVYSEAKAYQKAYKEALPIAKKLIRRKNGKQDEKREHSKFSNEQVWEYWKKQITIVEHIEEIFSSSAQQFSEFIVEDALADLSKDGVKVDKEELLDRAVNKFTPALNEVLILSGQLANRLVGIDEPYIPTKQVNTREAIKEQILLFAGSMIDTDIDIMANILAEGLDEGSSIAKIRREIQDKFFEDGKYSKTQAERITRTEVLKSSNLGTQDAFEQSGVVVGKQWLTAEDDRTDEECASMNGQIVELEGDYDSIIKSKLDNADKILSYSSVDYPPLHPNCRCTLLPVIEGQDDFDIRSFEKYQDLHIKIAELEQSVDKRTKEYKQSKQEYEKSEQSKTELQEYVKELEKLAGLGNEK